MTFAFSRAAVIALRNMTEVYLFSELYVIFFVVPLALTASAISWKLVDKSGYIVSSSSDTCIISMLFILFLSTVTCISTGVPFRDIEAVYTPGVYIFSLYVPVLLSEITFEELVVLAGFPSLSEEFAADTIKKIRAMIMVKTEIAPIINAFIWITTIFVFEFICTHFHYLLIKVYVKI